MRQTRRKPLAWATASALVLAVGAVGIVAYRRIPSPAAALPASPVRLADALAKSKLCIECHDQIAEQFEGDKHVADDFHCVVCHGESVAHRDQEFEGAKPDRSWRRWMAEDNRYEWRMEKATLEIARFCAGCHAQQAPQSTARKTIDWDAYVSSRHGRAVAKGKPDAPTCTDCHGSHGVGAKPWTDSAIVENCAVCHADKEMMERAKLNSDVVRDFEADAHAEMSATSPERKSSCVPCHAPHSQLPE